MKKMYNLISCGESLTLSLCSIKQVNLKIKIKSYLKRSLFFNKAVLQFQLSMFIFN